MRNVATLLAVLATAIPAPAAAKRVLIITDPQTSTKPITLLEHALVEALRKGGHTLLKLEKAAGKQPRGRRILQQAEALRQAARHQFDQLELDIALKKYNKALGKLDKVVAVTDDLNPLTDTLAMLGATYLLLGQERRARGVLERLLVVDLAVQPDEAVYNPQMMAVFEAVASRVRGSTTFDVEVTVDPPGAAVLFDGRLAGVAPVTLHDIRAGRHYVTASLKGFETVGRAIDIKARSAHNIAIQLFETRGDSRTQVQASAAVAAMDDDEIPPEARELARGRGAEVLLLLGLRGSVFKVARYDESGGRNVTTMPANVQDVDSAHRVARKLLGPLVGKPDGTVTETAPAQPAEDEGFTDDFDDEAEQHPHEGRDQDEDEDLVVVADADTSTDSSGFHLFSANPTKDTTLYLTYGTTLALAAAGGVFGILTLGDHNEYNKSTKIDDGQGGSRVDHENTTDQMEGIDIKAAGETNAMIADILFGAAIAAGVTSILLHWLWDPDRADTVQSPSDSSEEGEKGDGWGFSAGPLYLRLDF
ncbi:PEGA domain-containing protein [Myxococcota bacterium]